MGALRRGQPRASPTRGRAVAADGRDGVGARLPAAARPRDAARACGPTCASASSCTSPSRPSELFLQLPVAQARSSRACSAPTSSASTPRAAPANFLAAHRAGCSASTPTTRASTCPTRPAQSGVRRVTVGAFPISIDTAEYDAIARTAEVQDRAVEIRAKLGNPQRVLLGVDRLDYTKGIDVRLKAFTELLEDGSIASGRRRVRPDRDARAARTSRTTSACATRSSSWSGARSATTAPRPSPDPVPAPAVRPRDARVASTSRPTSCSSRPYRDGMNLVARSTSPRASTATGALVLSEFAGAAVELDRRLPGQPVRRGRA